MPSDPQALSSTGSPSKYKPQQKNTKVTILVNRTPKSDSQLKKFKSTILLPCMKPTGVHYWEPRWCSETFQEWSLSAELGISPGYHRVCPQNNNLKALFQHHLYLLLWAQIQPQTFSEWRNIDMGIELKSAWRQRDKERQERGGWMEREDRICRFR